MFFHLTKPDGIYIKYVINRHDSFCTSSIIIDSIQEFDSNMRAWVKFSLPTCLNVATEHSTWDLAILESIAS